MSGRRKSSVFFAGMIRYKLSFFEICYFNAGTYVIKLSRFQSLCATTANMMWKETSDQVTPWQCTSYNNLCMVKLCRQSVLNLLSHSEQWVREWFLEKNHIEFERGSKLLEISSKKIYYLFQHEHYAFAILANGLITNVLVHCFSLETSCCFLS